MNEELNNEPLSLKDIHDLLFKIMIDVDAFCRHNDIPYTIAAGTMLGAVRHGGFIPWDDDADLFMLREDFDRFVATYKSDKYSLVYKTDNNDEFLYSGYAKICDPTTDIQSRFSQTRYGVFVDVFPLDSVPEDPNECRSYMHKVMSTHNRLYHRQKKDIISIIKSYRHSIDWWWNKLNDIVHEGKYDSSPIVAQAIGTDNYRTVLPKSWFNSLVDYTFEGHKFLGFKDSDAYLSMLYGKDYMTPKIWSHNLKVMKK